jgi:hypothetical protein
MPEYRRPSLVNANTIELSEHLRTKGIECSTRLEKGDALYITIAGTSAELTSALSDFPNTGVWRQALPAGILTHAQHLIDYAALTPAQLVSLPQASKDHVEQDIIRALKFLLDDRLG